METKRPKRQRRSFTDEFKAGAVRLVGDGRSIRVVAEELDVPSSCVSRWVEQARVDRGQGKDGQLTTVEKQELSQLRREVKQLRMEREILKKAAVHSHGHCNTWYEAVNGETWASRSF